MLQVYLERWSTTTAWGKSQGPITPKFIQEEKLLGLLAGARKMDRLIAMQIKKRSGGWQFQTKYISLTHLPSSYQAPSGYANTSKYACLGRMTSLGGIPATPGDGMMSSVHIPATSMSDFDFIVFLFPSIFTSDNSWPWILRKLSLCIPQMMAFRCFWVGYWCSFLSLPFFWR